MTHKSVAIITAAVLLLVISSAMAETAVVDTIMNVGTAQVFTDEAVSADDLNTIMRAGLAAASAINQQPWFFVAITNQELMDEIAGSGMGFAPPAGLTGKPDGGPGEGRPAPPMMTGGAKAGLGDSPAAIIIYRNDRSKSPNADFDCGLAAQNMVIAAASLGYGVKIVSSPVMMLNGGKHDALCEKMAVDPAMQAVAVLLIGRVDNAVDAGTAATTRETLETKTNFIE
ncbi:MAG TPA: nitroreductase family protein [Clostridia bacterium]|nr:nitroreductase family protein [Clostridia bacterium]HQA97720.1 nitroreductase family protein [Clostridia bacterium]HQO55756.1 nitroreductase family protein [Clostridia bacterium]HUM60671.1 nitroreductase family protein [Clostridia bacterium]